jgi:hypothetical protein
VPGTQDPRGTPTNKTVEIHRCARSAPARAQPCQETNHAVFSFDGDTAALAPCFGRERRRLLFAATAGTTTGCNNKGRSGRHERHDHHTGREQRQYRRRRGGGKNIKLAFVVQQRFRLLDHRPQRRGKSRPELANATVEFCDPAEGTAADQQQKVDDLLVKGIDGMAISPVDPKNQTPMLNAAAERTIVFTQIATRPSPPAPATSARTTWPRAGRPAN